MNYLSVCSGVEAASQAWEPLGWTPVAFSEIEPFPCAVLASRFPNVPNLGDMSKIHYDYAKKELTNGTDVVICDGGIDILVGGTPCQSFSVAGKRAGLEGASGLAYHYARLIGEIRPRWFVWENVPGALSSVTYGDQRDFNFLLQQFAVGGDADLGVRWNCCWRVLDTQYVRVERYPRAIPQRRRRVFIVGHLAADCGGGCEVLLEPEGVRGDSAPRRVKGKGVAGDIEKGVGGADDAINCAIRGNRSASERGKLIESDFTRCAYTVTGVQTDSMAAVSVVHGSMDPISNPCECANAIGRNDGAENCVAVSFKGGQSSNGGLGVDDGACQTMQSKMSALEPTVAVSFLPTNTAKARSLGEAEEVAPTMARGGGESGNKPSVAIRTANGETEPYNIMTCDGGSHKRGDRPNGGMYIRKADAANCIASSGNGDTVVAVKTANTTANGDNVNTSGAAYTIDGANGQAVAVGINGECAGTLDSNYFKGCGERQGTEREVVAIGIGRDAFNSGANAQMAQSISTEVQPPITAKGPGGVCTNGGQPTGRM